MKPLILTITLMLIIALSATAAPASDNDRLPLAAGICVNKAQMLFQAGEVQKAIDLLETGIHKKNYKHHYLHFLLGNYYLSLSQDKHSQDVSASQKAAQCYRAAIKTKPSFSAAWLNLAKCCYEAENYSEAALAFEKGYEKAIHLYYAAVCHFQSQDSEKALTLFKRLMANHPDEVTLNQKEILVNILFSLDRYKQALPHIKKLAQKSKYPKQKKWQEILLHQYLNLGFDKKALSYARYLTRTNPLEPKWWKTLCHIHLKNNNPKKGLSALIIYGFLTPMTREELMLTADLYFTLDIPIKAADTYEQIVQQFAAPNKSKPEKSRSGRACLMLGHASMSCSQLDRAEKAYKMAAQFEKQKKAATKAIARIKLMKEHQPSLSRQYNPYP